LNPLITVATATTGNPLLIECIESLARQTYRNIHHLLVVDGPEHLEKVQAVLDSPRFKDLDEYNYDVLVLPYSTGKDGYLCHRIYGFTPFVAKGDYISYLDDDNYLDPDHFESLLGVIKSGKDWAYSLRKVVNKSREVICTDDCESLGKWSSVIHPDDYLIDTNCYFLPKLLAVSVAPQWHRKTRIGQLEADRAVVGVLKQFAPNFDCSYKYTVNYTVGNNATSVQGEFFLKGNAEMLRRYNGSLPWKK
jgi:glycosyltransferase involved in cell wall biosynthesis